RPGLALKLTARRCPVEPSQQSRALAVNPRRLDILERTGVTSRMLARGLRIHGVRFYRITRPRQETDMSLDDTSHPGGPRPDELVPSRYAVRGGEIDVLVVSDGVLSLPGAMLAHNADPAVRAAWLNDRFLPSDVLEWALNVVVVRSGGRTILIDAGM